MKIETAQQIAEVVTELAVVVSQYQAQFGRHHRLVPTSHPEAIRLHKTFQIHQAHIARLLDLSALESVVETDTIWWKRLDMMDNVTISELGKHIFHLISCCAYPDNHYNLTVIQSVIAGFIEPDIRFRTIHQLLDGHAIN